MDKFKAVFTANTTDGYNVLNHGDFHYKNMMVKQGGDKSIEDVLFVSIVLMQFCK